MPKPRWLQDHERHARLRHCMTCVHKGHQCGITNYLGKDRGRLPMYECLKHPNIVFYEDTYACEDYERP